MNIDVPRMFKTHDRYKDYCAGLWKEVKGMEAKELYGKQPDDILSFCGQADSVPVDLKEVLRKLNISALPLDFSSMEEKLTGAYENRRILGAMITNEKGTAIFYDEKEKKDSHRTRFTIAHEIAHCCLHGPGSHVEFRMDGEIEDDDEIAANTFAGALLIPEHSLRNTISQLLIPTITALAKIFDVSFNVMNQRVIYLGLDDEIACI